MKRPLELLKSALVTGLIIVLPAWLALLLLLQLLLKLGVLVKPIAAQMPKGIDHPQIIAAAVFILICLAVGLLVHTAAGRLIGRTLGENVFNRVPGYQPLRNIARQFSDMNAKDGFKPALIEVEDLDEASKWGQNGTAQPSRCVEEGNGGGSVRRFVAESRGAIAQSFFPGEGRGRDLKRAQSLSEKRSKAAYQSGISLRVYQALAWNSGWALAERTPGAAISWTWPRTRPLTARWTDLRSGATLTAVTSGTEASTCGLP
jgi:hypothetical protein